MKVFSITIIILFFYVLLFGYNSNKNEATSKTSNKMVGAVNGLYINSVNDNITGTGLLQFDYLGLSYQIQIGNYMDDGHYGNVRDSYAKFRFYGTQVKVYSKYFMNHGIYGASIDGGIEIPVDQYNPSVKYNTLQWTGPLMALGNHTLKMRITGTKNISSTGYYMYVDRIDFTSNPNPIINDFDSKYSYYGNWTSNKNSVGSYNNDEHYSNSTDTYYKVVFYGAEAKVYSSLWPSNGIIAYSIDNGIETKIDQYQATGIKNTPVWTSNPLYFGNHTLKVRITGTKNVKSSGTYGSADRVDILPW